MSELHENPNFKSFIHTLLSRAELGDDNIKKLTDKKCMIEWTKAFTHKSIDPLNNYEFYEILGDATANKIVVWYNMKRYKYIFDKPGEGNMGRVGIMSRLKQKGVSTESFSAYAESMGYKKYIRYTEEYEKDRTKMSEDVFESFIGCLENLIDEIFLEHSGYGICYIFMAKILDTIEISFEKEKLYDPKSLINEEINSFKGRLKIEYNSIDRSLIDPIFKSERYNEKFESTVIIREKASNKILYQSKPAIGPNKKIAESKAAKNVLDSGFFDHLRKQYQ